LLAILAIVLNNKISYKVEAPKVQIGDFEEVSNEVKSLEKKRIRKEIGKDFPENLTEKGVDELKEVGKNYKKQLDDVRFESKKKEFEIQSLKNGLRLEDRKKTELKNKEIELRLIEEREKSLRFAIEKLDEAYSVYKSQVLPSFAHRIGDLISECTDSKYKTIKYTDDNEIMVEGEYGNLIPIEQLSFGTIDELYVSFRLAALDRYESVPIILDESFAYFDDKRLENVLKLLSRISNAKQIIILSCSNREEKLLNKLNANYNLIDFS
jgi:uncharacterized protein YhaN